jgi:hypothetical protein
MHVEQAAYNTVHESDGGAQAIATVIGMSHQVLLNKLNKDIPRNQLTLKNAVDLMHAAKDTRILDALANEFNGMFVPLPTLSIAVAPNFMSDIAKMSSEFGALIKEVAEDLSDGEITENEWVRIDREAAKLREALAMLMGHLRRSYEGRQLAS